MQSTEFKGCWYHSTSKQYDHQLKEIFHEEIDQLSEVIGKRAVGSTSSRVGIRMPHWNRFKSRRKKREGSSV